MVTKADLTPAFTRADEGRMFVILRDQLALRVPSGILSMVEHTAIINPVAGSAQGEEAQRLKAVIEMGAKLEEQRQLVALLALKWDVGRDYQRRYGERSIVEHDPSTMFDNVCALKVKKNPVVPPGSSRPGPGYAAN